MSTSDLLADMSRGWNRSPAGVALGTERTGVSAALWTHDKDSLLEVSAACSEIDVISLQLRATHADVGHDGRATISGRFVPGAVNLTRAGEHTKSVIYGRMRVLQFYLPTRLTRSLVEEESLASGPVELIDPATSRDPVIERIGREVLAEMLEGRPLSRLRIDALGQDLAIRLLRRWSTFAGSAPLKTESAQGGLAPWQTRRTIEFLTENLSDDVSLELLARISRLSTFHFARAFKRSTGLPPHGYLRRLRSERAKELLDDTALSVGDIAVAVGYETPQAFARMFRAEVGASPSEYRRARKA